MTERVKTKGVNIVAGKTQVVKFNPVRSNLVITNPNDFGVRIHTESDIDSVRGITIGAGGTLSFNHIEDTIFTTWEFWCFSASPGFINVYEVVDDSSG